MSGGSLSAISFVFVYYYTNLWHKNQAPCPRSYQCPFGYKRLRLDRLVASKPGNSKHKDSRLENNTVLTSESLADLARSVRLEVGESQEEAAARLDVGQSHISKAENGVESYFSLCVRIVEEYTDCTVEYPLCRITR